MKNQRKKRRKKHLFMRVVFGALSTALIATVVFVVFCGFLYLKSYNANAIQDVPQVSLAGFIENHVYTIVLDAGHGGKDQGTSYGSTLEKDINLTVVTHLKSLLEDQGYNVVLTRGTDKFIELEDRSAMANDIDADLFISIHCNYSEDSTAVSGLECHYYPDSSQGQELAQDIINYLDDSVLVTTHGAIANDFSVLRNSKCPATLIELGYLSNQTDRTNLTDSDYVNELCKELVRAIENAIE